MKKTELIIPGIHIQWPWSQYIVDGKKIIETRSYPLSKKYIGQELAIIETSGPRGRKEAGILKARIIGTVIFERCFKYNSKNDWMKDLDKHLVDLSDQQFSYEERKETWGWVISNVWKLETPSEPPTERGIVYALNCKIFKQLLKAQDPAR